MLKRRAPATASGLKTLRDCGAWPYLLDAPYDVEAVNALAALGGRTRRWRGGWRCC